MEMEKLKFFILTFIFATGLFGQSIEPAQFQPSIYKNGILKAVQKVFDEWTGDTVYYYKHDTLTVYIDSIYITQDSILCWRKDRTTYCDTIHFVDEIGTDTSGYNLTFRRSNDTLYIKDGHGQLFVKLPAGTVDTDNQKIDTFQLYDGNKIRISLQRDGEVYKTLTLPAVNPDSLTWDEKGDSLYLRDGDGVYYIPRIFDSDQYTYYYNIPNPRKFDIFVETYSDIMYYDGENWKYFDADSDPYNEGNIYFDSIGIDTVAIRSSTNPQSAKNIIGGIGIKLNKGPLIDNMIFDADTNYLATQNDLIGIDTDKQKIDTFRVVNTNKLQISLENDGEIYKEVTLPLSDSSKWTRAGYDLYNKHQTDSVGINTANPGRTLDVNGEVRIRDLQTGSARTLIAEIGDGTFQQVDVGHGLQLNSVNNSLNNLVRDSTIINEGWGIDVVESPANSYLIKVDSTQLVSQYDLTQITDTDTQDLSIDSLNRVFTLSLVNGGNVKFKDSNPADSTVVEDGYGTYVYEISPNNWKIEADTNQLVTPFDLSQVDQSATNELQTLSADSTATTIAITASGNNSRVHFSVLKSEVDGSITNEKIDSFYLKTSGQLRLREGGTVWSINSMLYGGSSLGANYLPIWSGGQSLTNYWGSGLAKVTAGVLSTVDDNSSNWNTAYSRSVSTWTTPLQFATGTASILQSGAAQSGYLSSTDWNTFNNKQSALTNPVTGTGDANQMAYFTGASTISSGSYITRNATTNDLQVHGMTIGKGKSTNASNVAFGNAALYSNTSGSDNSAIGYQALLLNETGSQNNAIGLWSLKNNISGSYNNAAGAYSLLNNNGSYNNAIGSNALAANTTGNYNNAVGYYALGFITTSNFNTGIGMDAGAYLANGSSTNITGANGTFIGASTKASADGNSNENVLGYNAIGNGSNSVTLGNANITKTILRASVGIGNIAPAKTLHVTGEARITDLTNGTATSVLGSTGDGDLTNMALSGLTIINGTLINSYTGTVTGTGTQNKVPKWNNTSGLLTDSQIHDDGTVVGVGGIGNTLFKLDVNGKIRVGTRTGNTPIKMAAFDNNGQIVETDLPTSGVTSVSGTSPIASSGGTTPAISIANAAADGSTKGAASFTANDFNASSGNISIDYTNGQTASGTTKGFLSSENWATFNSKFTLPALTSGSVLFSNGTTIAQDNTKFFWDDTNDRLGIGNNAPSTNLHVTGSVRVTGLSATGNQIITANTTGVLSNLANGTGLLYNNGSGAYTWVSGALPALTDGKIWIGNSVNAASERAMSGDATIDNMGVVAVANDSHTHAAGTITTDIVSSVENVANDGGNIDLIGDGISITGDNTNNNITFAMGQKFLKAYASDSTKCASTWHKIKWNYEIYNTGTFTVNSGGNYSIQFPSTGYYEIETRIMYVNNNTANERVESRILLNGAEITNDLSSIYNVTNDNELESKFYKTIIEVTNTSHLLTVEVRNLLNNNWYVATTNYPTIMIKKISN